MKPYEILANVLKVDKDYLLRIHEHLSTVASKPRALSDLVERNEHEIRERLLMLGVPRDCSVRELYDALISKVEADDTEIAKFLGYPDWSSTYDSSRILQSLRSVVGSRMGFVLKREVAESFLRKQPPKRVMEYLHYDDVDTMLAHEDFYEIWCALRFLESSEWLNTSFFSQYASLTPADFEEREIVVKVLSSKWRDGARPFVEKKWHNISHLKELGIVFILPVMLGHSGELLRLFSLVFHYLHEIPFYSQMFRRAADLPTTFGSSVISLLRGDVIERRISDGDRTLWLVVQRYLIKDDEHDWRLFVPRVNPEALHWYRAIPDLVKFGEIISDTSSSLAAQLKFWCGADSLGDYFRDEVGSKVFVSFNLVDAVMSLVKREEMITYNYHFTEALWNAIFAEYFTTMELEKFAHKYLLQGYFEI